MTETSELLQLVQGTIAALDAGNIKLSAAIRSCVRIARLRNDFVNLLWLQRETIDNQNEYERSRVFEEISPHFTKEKFDSYRRYFLEMWIKERPVVSFEDGEIRETGMIIGKSVAELEDDLESMISTYNIAQTPSGLSPYDTYKLDQENFDLRSHVQVDIKQYQKILNNIKNRVYDFLSQTEKQLIYGQFHADFLESNRQYVELRLGQLCKKALDEFVSAVQRAKENTPETRSQALFSCRRLLKDLADVLYPPSGNQVLGADGKSHDMSEEKYINRLWQFVIEKIPQSSSSDLLKTTIDDLGYRIDRINDLLNKGVHDEVNEFEVNQCLIQTYLVIGDLLRIYDKQSAIGKEDSATAN